MSVVSTSSFQLPDSSVVEIVIVKLPDGRLVARHPDELVKRPTPPAGPR